MKMVHNIKSYFKSRILLILKSHVILCTYKFCKQLLHEPDPWGKSIIISLDKPLCKSNASPHNLILLFIDLAVTMSVSYCPLKLLLLHGNWW